METKKEEEKRWVNPNKEEDSGIPGLYHGKQFGIRGGERE